MTDKILRELVHTETYVQNANKMLLHTISLSHLLLFYDEMFVLMIKIMIIDFCVYNKRETLL